MVTSVTLDDKYGEKLNSIQEALPVNASYAEIVRQGIEIMYEEYVEEGE